MEDLKAEKFKLKLKISKQFDNYPLNYQQEKLYLHIKQEQASYQLKDEDFDQVVQEDDDQDGVVDDEDELEEQEQHLLDDEQEQEVVKDQRKICPHCGKEFKNGKALGGHLRVHAENSGRPNSKTKKTGSSPDPGSGEMCDICGKNFPSQKSLHGHMRSHPERGYRGMHPPEHGSNPPSMDHDMDADSDDHSSGQLVVIPSAEKGLEGLIGWKVKGLRGRVSESSVEPSEVSSSLLSNGHLAAGDLMMLTIGSEEVEVKSELKEKNNDIGCLKRKILEKINEYDEDELYFLKNILGFSYNSSPNGTTTTNTPLSSTTFDYPNKGLRSIVPSQKVIKTNEEIISFVPSKKRKVIKDLESLEVVSNHNYDVDKSNDDHNHDHHDHDDDIPRREFKCTTCGRSFDTHQALGGHRSSHNKERATHSKNPNPNLTLAQVLAQAQAQTLTLNGDSTGLTQSGTVFDDGVKAGSGDNGEEIMMGELVHKCKICNQGFSSGQALGGHQRCHYIVQSTESSPGQTSSQTGRQGIIHGLDLNVAMQEEDGEVEVDVESTYNS